MTRRCCRASASRTIVTSPCSSPTRASISRSRSARPSSRGMTIRSTRCRAVEARFVVVVSEGTVLSPGYTPRGAPDRRGVTWQRGHHRVRGGAHGGAAPRGRAVRAVGGAAGRSGHPRRLRPALERCGRRGAGRPRAQPGGPRHHDRPLRHVVRPSGLGRDRAGGVADVGVRARRGARRGGGPPRRGADDPRTRRARRRPSPAPTSSRSPAPRSTICGCATRRWRTLGTARSPSSTPGSPRCRHPGVPSASRSSGEPPPSSVASAAPLPRRTDREADHPDAVPQRGGPAPDLAGGAAPRGAGLRRRRVADHRRRVDRPHDRRGQGPRRRPHRQAHEQQGARLRVPGRAGRVPQARRRRHRQHRRRQPVLGRRHPHARGSDRRRRGRHGDRRPQRHGHRALLVREEAPPADGQLGGAPSVGHGGARRDVGLPGLQPGGRPRPHRRVPVHLHARVAHPGGQEPRRGGPRGGGHQPAAARVAAVRVDVGLRPAEPRGHLPHLHGLRAAEGLQRAGGHPAPAQHGGVVTLRVGLDRERRHRWPPAVDRGRGRPARRGASRRLRSA